jgi:hypothetical protein
VSRKNLLGFISGTRLEKINLGALMTWGEYGLKGQKKQMAELSRFYGRKDEPGRYTGAEKAVRFRQLLLRAIAEEIITLSKAAALDGKKLADFRTDMILKKHENSDH